MQRYIIMCLVLGSSGLQASHGMLKVKERQSEQSLKEAAAAQLDFASANTYYEQAITAENIMQLAPQPPVEMVATAQEYLINNKPLGNILSGACYCQPILFYDKVPYDLDFTSPTTDQNEKKVFFDALRAALEKLGIKVKLGLNFIIDLDDNWIIKASGFSNRLNNINGQIGNAYGSSVTPEQFAQFMQLTNGKTYQTISRLAYWLRAHEAKEKLNLDRIRLPKQYLVHIPGRPTTVEDANYIIVEEKIHDTKPLIDTPLAEDPAVIQQLTQLIGYTGLWDINSNNFLVHGDQVCVIDTEQPSNHKPLDFFHKNVQVHRDNVHHGWGELENHIIKPYGEKHKKDMTDLLNLKLAMQTSIQNSWK